MTKSWSWGLLLKYMGIVHKGLKGDNLGASKTTIYDALETIPYGGNSKDGVENENNLNQKFHW